jgi:hypothetical protein
MSASSRQRVFTFTMTDVMLKKNTVSASKNVTVPPGSRSSSTWRVEFDFNP